MKNPAAQLLGRLGGMAKSEAKIAASRANGKLGGRPKGSKMGSRKAVAIIASIILFSQTAFASIQPAYAEHLADAIKLAENSKTYPYGIIAKRKLSETEARRWCLNTIRHSYQRWETAGKPGDFIEWLSKTYCPIGASNDPKGLNRNWERNVRKLLKK
jgi:hypothetical protein